MTGPQPTPTPAVKELERVADILTNRDLTHGSADDTFAHIARGWSEHLGVKISPADVAVMMIDLKKARIASSGIAEEHLEDIVGYGALALVLSREKLGENNRDKQTVAVMPSFETASLAAQLEVLKNAEAVAQNHATMLHRRAAEQRELGLALESAGGELGLREKAVALRIANVEQAEAAFREKARFYNNQARKDPLFVAPKMSENIEDYLDPDFHRNKA